MFFEQFKKLCDINNVTPTSVLTDIGIQKSNATNWKNGSMPSLSVLIQLADYFSCSLDFLIGREINSKKTISCDILNDLGIKKVEEYIQDLTDNPKYLNNNSISHNISETIKAVDNFTIPIKQK